MTQILGFLKHSLLLLILLNLSGICSGRNISIAASGSQTDKILQNADLYFASITKVNLTYSPQTSKYYNLVPVLEQLTLLTQEKTTISESTSASSTQENKFVSTVEILTVFLSISGGIFVFFLYKFLKKANPIQDKSDEILDLKNRLNLLEKLVNAAGISQRMEEMEAKNRHNYSKIQSLEERQKNLEINFNERLNTLEIQLENFKKKFEETSYRSQNNEITELETEDDLVKVYKNQPHLLNRYIDQRILITQQNSSWIFTANASGRWLIVCKGSIYWLVPEPSFKINSFIYDQCKLLFECINYDYRHSGKFQLIKPACVSPRPDTNIQNEWQLLKPGRLEF